MSTLRMISRLSIGSSADPAIELNLQQRLAKLGIGPERIDSGNMQWILTGAGVIGPNHTYINVLYLKGGAP